MAICISLTCRGPFTFRVEVGAHLDSNEQALTFVRAPLRVTCQTNGKHQHSRPDAKGASDAPRLAAGATVPSALKDDVIKSAAGRSSSERTNERRLEITDAASVDEDEEVTFGDVSLSVKRIPPPPGMEITVNRKLGTPAEATTRPAAAVAAKAAAESKNKEVEWVDGDPVPDRHQHHTKSQRRQSKRIQRPPSDLTGLTGEMRMVEMACLAGLSSDADKNACLVMHEQIGFSTLLRGLRDDVRPSLRRRVMQAMACILENDPSMAPILLAPNATQQPEIVSRSDIRRPDSQGANDISNGKKVGKRILEGARSLRAVGARAEEPMKGTARGVDDDLVDSLVSVLRYWPTGNALGGIGSFVGDMDVGLGALHGVGRVGLGSVKQDLVDDCAAQRHGIPGRLTALVGQVIRGIVAFLPLPSVRPSALPVGAPAFLRSAASATSRVMAGSMGSGSGVSGVEGRDWWKDDVALEEEEVEEKTAALAAEGGWGWWWGRGYVSQERLVEEALELLFRLVMCGDTALEALRGKAALMASLRRVAESSGQRLQYDIRGVLKRKGQPLDHSQKMAYKILAALGGHKWTPKSIGQKGIRILCFDGGGTRGVLSLALLKHIEKALGGRQPHEVFDMIVGTSTGGIIAGLAGVEALPVSTCEEMYDQLIGKIFVKHPTGGMKLALKQAFYDEVTWMNILQSILGDQLLIDSAADPLRPLILCPSTLISSNPARLMLWRNYNYPPTGEQSRYYGSFRHMVREAIRATTAAPTFFAPLMINGALYSDGALLCNNPSAVAYHEAKRIFPGVPIEAIVSLGTGCFFEEKRVFMEPSVGWDGIINQVIASATETETTTDIVADMLPSDQYFRFNPRMKDMPIDEVRKERLDWLKTLADEYFQTPENQARLQEMATKLLPP